MKSKLFIFAIALLLVSCTKNENDVSDPFTKTNPEELYAKTEYNLDMRDFALAVNEAISSNKSFRKLIKEEVNKKFDGDFNVLLTKIVERKVENYQLNTNGIVMRVAGNVSVRDLLNSSFLKAQEKAKKKDSHSFSERKKTSAFSVVDQLTQQYPDLQIAVPFLEEQLEDENYVPPVVFLPEEYDEQTTEYLPAINADGEYAQYAKELPDYACIVIDHNERMSYTINDDTPIPTPISLIGVITESGISLSWIMPVETDQSNTSGYKIYRKTDNGDYDLIYTNISPNNRSYIDSNLDFNKIYYYYVVSYNDFKISPPIYCNNGQGIIINTRPASATIFEVNPIGPNSVRFRWNFGDSNNNGELNIYKREYYTEEYTTPFYNSTLPVNGDECVKYNVPAGSQLEYKITRTTPIGTSAPKYDLLFMPYRDVSQKSSVYIKRLKHSDVSQIESWRGAPEYVIKGWRVKKDGTNHTVVEEFSTTIQCHKDQGGEDDTWETINRLVMSDWQPGFDGATWYDKLSFYAIELDDDGSLLDNIATTAKFAEKIYTEWGKTSSGNTGETKVIKSGSSKIAKITPTVIAAIVVSAVEVAGLITKWVKSKDERIGNWDLDYFENPKKTVVIPAEAGGVFTIELSDTSY